MGLGAVPCYVMLALLIAPAMETMGVPLIVSHLFMFYYGIASHITPPVAIGAYVASGIAGTDPMKTGWNSVRVGILTFIVPFMFLYQPGLLIMGSVGEIVIPIVTGVLGTCVLAWSISGYGFREMKLWERVLLGGSGLVLMVVPSMAANIAGAGVAIGLLFWQRRTIRPSPL